MSVLAHLDPFRHVSDRRSAQRRTLSLTIDGTVGSDGLPAIVHDLSETGLLLETMAELGVGDELEVNLPRRGTTRARVVWNSGAYLGCEFEERISAGTVSAALLRSAPAKGDPVQAPAPSPDEPSIRADPDMARLSARRSFFTIVGLSVAAWAIVLIAWLAL